MNTVFVCRYQFRMIIHIHRDILPALLLKVFMALDHGVSDETLAKAGNFTYPNGTVAILNESIGIEKGNTILRPLMK